MSTSWPISAPYSEDIEGAPHPSEDEMNPSLSSDDGSGQPDVTLISSDDEHIPVNRSKLSKASSYFDKLFNSEFAERGRSQISVPLHSSLLKEVLLFINTSTCCRLKLIEAVSPHTYCRQVRAVVELVDAASYMCVDQLLGLCEEELRLMMKRQPHLASAAVQELEQGRVSWGRGLLSEAAKVILKDPGESLLLRYGGCELECGLSHLNAQTAEDVFKELNDEIENQDKLFQALIVWATGGTALRKQWSIPEWADCKIAIEIDDMNILDDRRETARRIAKRFDFESMKTGFLTHIVERSGLVEKDMLYSAYKAQAEKLEELRKVHEGTIASMTFELKQRKSG